MNYKAILFFLGIFSLVVSIFSILNILYTIYFDFFIDLNSYLLTFIISILIGLLFCFIGYKNHQNISLSEQILFILLSFLFLHLY